ncbi:hypothetical protein [Streptomyces sp. NPDC018610]|uniref:hypothetical protein n=1 Tax=Streptomyces sp. NPDC018610 TaxID=3365049 RepID=UPI0037B0F5DE
MPRGRHRHSPPLHRLLPPSAIAGVSLVCALGPWVFTAPALLRSLAAAAAVTAIAGAIVMRRWDAQAGRQVADLTRARAGDEWRFEERVAELESDLEESRELRVRLEKKLRAKRTELAGLRNEHAALLRRYATAETERASALEGRRLLEIEAAPDARALPPAPATSAPVTSAAPAVTGAPAAPETEGDGAAADGTPERTPETEKPAAVAPAVFSPEGSELFLRAGAALARLAADGGEAADEAFEAAAGANSEPEAESDAEPVAAPDSGAGADAAVVDTDVVADAGRAAETAVVADADADADADARPAPEDGPGSGGRPEASGGHEPTVAGPAGDPAVGTAGDAAEADRADESATTPASARPGQRPDGHFAVPTAVAVVPAAPVRRPAVEGGFDFFGTKKGAPPAALEAVQNEDLADVVGQEALALHKAEAESQYRPADAGTRAVGQVIDLTAHDETEQIDVQDLRTAAS